MISIHLMLLFIIYYLSPCISIYLISIHLMLLFIASEYIFHQPSYKFQYISCYCLSQSYHLLFYSISISIHLMLLFITSRILPNHISLSISIHLMLLFICGANGITNPYSSFQYISCYCLSSYGGDTSGVNIHFNTSHVTVYRMVFLYFYNFVLFQYISCYCLSVATESESVV